MKKIIIVFLSFAILTVSGSALALDDHIIEKAYFEDPSGYLTFDQAQEKLFTPYEGLLNRGYNRNVYWLKIRYARKSPNERIFLRILPTFIDDIKIYEKVGENWEKEFLGDLSAYSQREHPATAFTHEILGHTSDVIYIEFRTKTSKIIDVQILNEKNLTFAEGRRDLLLGIYFGILALLISWTIYSNYVLPDKVIFFFMLFQMSEFIHGFSLMGYLSKYILPDDPVMADDVTSIFVLLHVLAGVVFNRALMHEIHKIKKLVYVYDLLTICNIGLLVAYFAVDKGAAVAASGVLVIPMGLALFYVPYKLRASKIGYERGMFWAYLLLACSLMGTIAPYLGILKAADFSLYASLLNGFVTLTALAFLLQQRRTDQELAFYEAKLNAELAQQEVGIEKLKREQQSQFMAMLNHELKTPLSIIKIAHSSDAAFSKFKGHISGAIEDITNVIDRSLLADKYDSNSLPIQKDHFFLEPIIKDKLENNFSKHEVVFQSDYDPQIESDLQITKIIISNILDNAKKYGRENSPIKIQLDKTIVDGKSYSRLSIANLPGDVGLPDESQLFSKYYRATKAYSKTGSGLGLYLIKSLSQLLGGDVLYEIKDEYIIFHFLLPLTT